MINKESQKKPHMDNCVFCIHVQFCLVKWGTDCKRQGGKKIPRMLSVFGQNKVAKQELKKLDTRRMKHNNASREPIRTKMANW